MNWTLIVAGQRTGAAEEPPGVVRGEGSGSSLAHSRRGRRAADMPGLRARALFRDLGSRTFSSGTLPDSPDPIRAELFSADRLEQHAESVAAQRVLAEGGSGRPLSPRVRDSGRVLLRCYRDARRGDPRGRRDHPGRGVARRQLPRRGRRPPTRSARICRRDSTASCRSSREGPLAGLSARARARLDVRRPHRQPLRAARRSSASSGRFQRVQPLTIGELWAVPDRPPARARWRTCGGSPSRSSRAARRGSTRTRSRTSSSGSADSRPASRLPSASRPPPCRRPSPCSSSSGCATRIPSPTPALRAGSSERLAAVGHVARRARARRASAPGGDERDRPQRDHEHADDGDVRLGEFFESVSLVDEVLRAESDFGAMDFATRDRYRHAIEDLARGSGRSELEVAQEAIAGEAGRAERPAGRPRSPGRGSRLLPHLEGPSRPRDGDSAIASRYGSGCCAPTWRARPRATSGTIGIVTAFALWRSLSRSRTPRA